VINQPPTVVSIVTDDGSVYHALRAAALATRCDDRRAVVIYFSAEFRTNSQKESVILYVPEFPCNTV